MKKNAFGRARKRLTYSNIIATLALFIALGGVSYAAATLPKNSVATKSIKRGAVTSPKIKNKTIVGADLKSNTLTGKQVNEASLVIPSSAFATSAGTANDTFYFVKTAVSSSSNADEATARAAATEIPLISYGAVSLYAKCFTNTTDPATHFEIIARTTANGSILSGGSDLQIGNPNSLNTNTAEDQRQVSDDETDSAPNNADDDSDSEVMLLGPDGKGLYFGFQSNARIGVSADPPALLPNGSTCLFQVNGRKVG
ncbi:MAG: hypothetical protein JHD02_11470 [Thermoleophilaceae bacterium]|nr:hypothetical protein [Thermoleophilaceae bacterium]